VTLRIFAILVLALWTAGAAGAVELAGTVTRVKGDATARQDGEAPRPLGEGSAIFVGDAVTTGIATRLEIRLTDDAVVILGDRVVLVVDHYVYAPGRGRGVLSLFTGVFKAASGGLAQIAGAPFRINTPAGTIGIRGTEFWGEQRADRLLVALLSGKGVFVRNPAGRVDIARPGFATRVPAPGQPPTPPFQLSPAELQRALGTVDF